MSFTLLLITSSALNVLVVQLNASAERTSLKHSVQRLYGQMADWVVGTPSVALVVFFTDGNAVKKEDEIYMQSLCFIARVKITKITLLPKALIKMAS